MPKTTKRATTRRATRVARAHATELQKLEIKEPKVQRRRPPGYKAPTRGIARYPWAVTILLALIALGVYVAYYNHVGPFALPKPKPKVVATVSPCLSGSILKQVTNTAPAPSASVITATTHTYAQAPAMAIDAKKTYCAGINTNRGLIVVELDPQLAPNTVNNFVFLAQHQFYDGLTFHRVIPDTSQYSGQLHIAQAGDPKGDGTGGPGYKFNDEPVKGNYTAGTLAMANSGANTNGSQFFINITDNTKSLAKSYNLFGHVVQGMNVVTKLQGPNEVNAAAKNIKPDVINHLVVVAAP